MTPIDPRDDLERLRPYIPEVFFACDTEGERRDVVCAVFLRETLAGWAPGYVPRGSATGFGDGFRAFGLAQADLRFFEAAVRGFLPGLDLLSAGGQAVFVCRHLASSRRVLRAAFPTLGLDLLERSAIAAYNAGIRRVAAQLHAERDPDAVTTPGPSGSPDYSRDVLARAERLRRRAPDLFPEPFGGGD